MKFKKTMLENIALCWCNVVNQTDKKIRLIGLCKRRIFSKGQNLERQIDLWPCPQFWDHRSVMISNQKTPGQ